MRKPLRFQYFRSICVLVFFFISMGMGNTQTLRLLDNTATYKCIYRESYESNSKRYKAHLSIKALRDEIIYKENVSYHLLTFDNHAVTNLLGDPQLPMVSQIIAIPDNASYSVSIIDEKWDTLSIGKIFPAQKPRCGKDNPEFIINDDIYASSLYSPELLRISSEMTMMDIENIAVNICPFKYYPTQGKLAVLKDFTLDVEFHRDDSVSLPMTHKENDFIIPPFFDNTMESGAENRNANNYSGYDYLIIVGGGVGLIYHGEIINQKLKDFIKWKAFKGHRVAVTTTHTTGSTCDDIKSYIIYFAHNNPNLKYVLFMGDEDVIPLKTSTSPYLSRTVKGDFWYGCFNGDDDYQAEVAIGRFPSNNTTELENMIDKSIKYEKENRTYQNRNLLVAGWRYSSEFDSYYVFRCTTDPIFEASYNEPMTFIKCYGGQSTPLQGGTDATNDTITTKINEGVNIITYSGHGIDVGWGDWNYLSQNFFTDQIDRLSDNVYPVFLNIACKTGAIDSNNASFLEAFLRTSKGASVVMGATNLVYGGADTPYVGKFFDYLLNYHVYNIGILNNLVHAYNTANEFNNSTIKDLALVYICGGDPSLELWTDTPRVLANVLVSTVSDSLIISTNEIDTFSVSIVSEAGELIEVRPVVNGLFSDTMPTDNTFYVINRHNYVPCIIKFDSQTHIIQNTSFDFDAYYTGAPLSVGYDITDTINYGNVIVKSGHKLTIERRQNVTIKNGFSVEPGATFQIK